MEYQLQQLASLTLVGIKETYENGRQAQQHIAGFWQRCYQEGVIADLQLKNNGDTTSEKYITEIWMPVKG